MNDSEAYAIVKKAWRELHGREGSTSEIVLAQAIQRLETHYGRDGQFAALAAQGKYNWGALERGRDADGSCPAGTEPGVDAGNARCFFVYSSDVAACKASLFTLTKAAGAHAARTSATLKALGSGDPYAVAAAMRTPPAYYEGYPNTTEQQKISAYGGLIAKNAEVIQSALGLSSLSGPSTEIAKKAGGVMLLLAGVAVVGYVAGSAFGLHVPIPRYFAKFA